MMTGSASLLLPFSAGMISRPVPFSNSKPSGTTTSLSISNGDPLCLWPLICAKARVGPL